VVVAQACNKHGNRQLNGSGEDVELHPPDTAFVIDQAAVTRHSKTVPRILLALASVALVLFCIELPALTGMLDYRTVIGPYHMWWAPNVKDPELLAIHRPHARQTGEARGGDSSSSYQIPLADQTQFRWDVTYDRHGFRNREELQSADIVVIGDSFVEGLTVNDGELATSQLSRLQGKVVANLGQSTYGPLQELIVFKRYGLPLHPRAVVWMFFEGNDLQDVIAYRHDVDHPATYWHAVWARSFTRSAYLTVKRLIDPPAKPPGVKRSGVLQTADGKPMTAYFMYRSKPLSSEELQAVDQTVQTLAAVEKLCAAQQMQLIFAFVPTKFRVLHDMCQFPADSECRAWAPTDLPERLQSGLRAAAPAIEFLDLTPYLTAAAQQGELPYYLDDEHWSPAGHTAAALAINSHLVSTQRAQGLLR
jgi:hypothetical protein